MSRISFYQFMTNAKENGYKVRHTTGYDDGGKYILYKDGVVISVESMDGMDFTGFVHMEIPQSNEIPDAWVSVSEGYGVRHISHYISNNDSEVLVDDIPHSLQWCKDEDVSYLLL